MAAAPLTLASDLTRVPLGVFLTHLNGAYKLGLQKKELEAAEKGLSDQWFNFAADLAQADSTVLMMIEPPISKPLLMAVHSFFHPNSALANNALPLPPAPAPSAAPAPLPPLPVAGPVAPVRQSSEGKNGVGANNKLDAPRASVAPLSNNSRQLMSAVGPASDSKASSEGADAEDEPLDDDKKASLEGLKKAVDQVCSDPKMAGDPYVVNQLNTLLKKGMSDVGTMKQSVLRDYMKRLQDAAAQAAANAQSKAVSPNAAAGAAAAADAKRPHPPLPPLPGPKPSIAVPNGANGGADVNGVAAALSKLTVQTDLKSAGGSGSIPADAMTPSPNLTHSCPLCGGAKDKAVAMDCKHQCCTSCLHDYITKLVGQKKAVGMKCPGAGCAKEMSVSAIKAALSAEEFNEYLESTLYAFMEEDKLTFTCPKAECKAFISIQPIDKSKLIVPKVMVEKDDDGKVLSRDAWLHFSEFRLRCRACQTIFCAQCKVIPYHKGYTCKGWTDYQSARHCRFCHCKLDANNTAPNPNPATNALRDVCTNKDCLARRDICCDKMLPCGCPCNGLRGESPCLPCLKHELNCADDFCPICFVEALSDAPCFQSTGPCKHVFHFHCAKQRLDTRWPGARVSFEFRGCPVCKQNMNSPALKQILAPIIELENFVQSKAVERLKYEGKDKDPQVLSPNGRYYNKPVDFAMHLFLFFMCYQCKKPYFAGGYQCQEANAPFDPKELICPSCQPSSVEDCPTHGKDWLAFKCKFCCNFANWYCWAKVHFCDNCHKDRVWQTLSEFRTGKNKRKIWDYPQCAGLVPLIDAIKKEKALTDDQKEAKIEKLWSVPALCPIKARHPPNGVEYGLGCSMCEDKRVEKPNDKPKQALAPSFALNLEKLKGELKATPRVFQYSHDFDSNGLCYWLGTSGHSAAWSNPCDAGFIKITTSELMGDSAPASAAVGREVVRCVSKPVRNSWFCFDFLDVYIQPTHYSLRHYSTWDTECLRFWVLEGSNDGVSWDPLCSHANDPGLNKKGGTKTWALPHTPKRYRMFRLIQTEKNSNGNFYLALSGFEIYGTLFAEAGNQLMQQPAVAVQSWMDSVRDMTVYEAKYASDFDTNGMMYHLGTQCGRSKTWQNPAEQGLVACACSELAWNPPSQPASAIVGRDAVRCVSAAKPNMWFSIDLKERKALVTHYTLRHYTSWDAEALRNWRLEGSNDGHNWTILRAHSDDAGLNGKGSTHTWQIERPEAKGVFSLFRIYQTGVNSNAHHYLACSGWEMYGKLYSPAGAAAPSAAAQALSTVTCTYTSDFDQNGVFYYLGSKGKTQAWKNPAELGLVQCYCSELASEPPSAPASAIVGRETLRCVSAAKPNMWFMIDLKDKRVNPSHYSLRHYLSWDTEALRYWRLEASNDGFNWEVLRNHVNDPALNRKGGTHTWALLTNLKGHGWRYFRLFQTGPNSNNHHYLALSGWEFYGTLTTLAAGAGPAAGAGAAAPFVTPQPLQPPQPQAVLMPNPMQPYNPYQPAAGAGAGAGMNAVVFAHPNSAAPMHPGANYLQPNPQQMMAVQPNNPYVNYAQPQQPQPQPQPQVGAGAFNPFGGQPQAQPQAQAAAMALQPAYVKPPAGAFAEGREFKYASDFDTNGIMYFLGTHFGTRSVWQNPGQTGLVQVSSAPLAINPPSLPAWAALSRAPCRCVTQAVPEAWFVFDLVSLYVFPTHYTLRHYDSWDNEALYDWKFQASNDAKKWKTLVVHKKDPALNRKSATKTWPIPKPKKTYRMFRILQTDKNNNGHFFCAVAGFELYGKLFTQFQQM